MDLTEGTKVVLIVSFSIAGRMRAERVCADSGNAVHTWCKLSSISDDHAT